jgi:hypothetical protein
MYKTTETKVEAIIVGRSLAARAEVVALETGQIYCLKNVANYLY